MTLNDIERRNSPYFVFFTELDSFAGQLRHVTVVQYRPIISAEYCIPALRFLPPPLRKLGEGGGIPIPIVERPNLRNTFDGRPLRGC